MKKITVVITTCGRTDLLEKTLFSFYKFNSYPIDKVVIVEDSGVAQNFETVKNTVNGNLEIIVNETNKGQIASIDKAYARVETDYIFHCEEDWEFYNSGFIEKSLEILNNDPKTFTVWLRSHTDTKNHAILKDTPYNLPGGDFYYRMDSNHKKVWCGFTFNPGLRRTSDCMIFYPYNNLDVKVVKNGLNLLGEMDLSIYYKEIGFYGSITSKAEGYVRHIGGKRHVPLPWQR